MLSKQNEVNHLIFQPEFPVYLYPICLSSWGGRSWVGDHIFKGMGMGFNKKPRVSAIGHFRVLPGLCIKTRLGAQLFLWKWVLFAWEWKIISISKVEHLTSFWYRGPGELGGTRKWPIMGMVRHQPLMGDGEGDNWLICRLPAQRIISNNNSGSVRSFICSCLLQNNL